MVCTPKDQVNRIRGRYFIILYLQFMNCARDILTVTAQSTFLE